MKKAVKGILSAALCVCLAVGSWGCGGSIGDLEYDFTETDDKIEYTFFSTNWQDYEGVTNDRILKHVEEQFNISIKITGSSGSTWQSRLSTEIADNKTPDVFFSLPNSSTYTDYIKKQIITDLDPYIEKAEANTLKTILAAEQYKETAKIGGKNYFVPQSVGYTTRVILVRKDWMKQWNDAATANGGRGLSGSDVYSEPKTLTEFTSMLTYFRDKDPNNDGIKNTYGLSLSNNFDYVQDFFATFGISPEYYLADGSYQLSALNDRYATMLNWFSNANEKGYIYTDFYTLTESEALQNFYQGICGAVVTSGDMLLDGVINEISNSYPGKDYNNLLTLIAPPDSDDGAYKGAFKGWNFYWGGWSISADAKEPMRLIRLLDYLFSPEGQKLMVYGIEDVHYTEADGVITPNLTERIKEGSNAFSLRDAAKATTPDGRYLLGYQLNPCPYTIVDNKLVINYPYDTATDAAFMKKSYDLTVATTPNFNALSTIIADPDINDYNTKIIDAVKAYSVNVISGKSQSAQMTELLSRLSSLKMDSVLEYINKNNK